MNVRALQTDMHDPKPLAQRRRDRGIAQRLVHRSPPQAPDLRRNSHHDMQWMIGLELRSRLVPLACPCTPGLSPCAAPLATAPEQLLLTCPDLLALRPRRPHARIVSMSALLVNDWALLIVIYFK